MDCASKVSSDVSGCNGGDTYGAYAYYLSEKSIVLSSDYPWTGESGDSCAMGDDPTLPVEVSQWNYITTQDASQIKAALA